ncbi:cupin domain-containing protein [Lysinibacillus mangiferihumi]|uniref:Cupin domain-containing protein n=1 Tax=Lysinibacillus mangiferihumi TaxID=1130819 RepID=A0A4U2YZQ5_9BACI|nr:cupin domain-containing protein [Lysinibacillus mangiferihumi]TKI66864.1 cupin domain-containing protein [Lysinibacillus mangiferihumi]
MNENKTKVKIGEALKWNVFTEHRKVYHRELLSAKEANELGVSVSSVLRERIEVGGAVLPHYHDVAEVIHITKGKVKLLQNGEWKSYQEGDTFLVPKGVVHSVANDDVEPTEQVSIFIPVHEEIQNENFLSHMVDSEK